MLRELTKTLFEIAFASLTGETKTGEKERLKMLEELQADFETLSEAETVAVAEADRATAAIEVTTEEFGSSIGSPVFAPTAMTFADMAAADAANETAENVRDLSRRFQTLFGNVMFNEEIDDKIGAVRGLVDELAVLIEETPTAESEALRDTGPYDAQEWTPPDTTYDTDWKIGDRVTIRCKGQIFEREITGFSDDGSFAIGEVGNGELHADGVAVETRDATEADLSEVEAAIESGRRSPVVVDFCILKPGPGNKKHNRYYPAGVVKRDIHVFEGVDVYATDHKEKERNERTKKGKVLQCPAYFTEDGSPIARTLIYDPDQAEKTRNRADANALNTMQCSIRGKGKAIPGAVDGRQYSIVQEMTKGLYLDLVSKGGAGGQAQALVESENGGEPMKDKEEKTTLDTDDVDTTEVDIEENEADQEPGEMPVMLESAVVDAALVETNLPGAFRVALRKGDYADADALQEAITEAIAEVKKLTGSGQVVGLGESEPPEAQTLTVEEVHKRHDERVEAVFAEVGL